MTRILLAFFGSVLLYVSLAMYENEEKQLKDRLADWWIRLEDHRERAENWLHAFVSATAATVNRWYVYVFGEALRSSDFFIISACLSFGCSYIALPIAQMLIPRELFPILRMDPERVALTYFLYILSGSVFFYAALVFIRRRLRRGLSSIAIRVFRIVIIALLALVLIFVWSARDPKIFFTATGLIAVNAALIVAIACDIFSIVSTRIALRWVVDSRRLSICALALTLNAAIAIGLIALPMWVAIIMVKKGYVAENTVALADIPAFIAAANLTTAIPGMVYFLAAAMLLIHPAFAFILRPLYLMEGKFPLTPNSRRMLALAGLTLIAYALLGYRAIEALMGFIGFPELIIFLLVGAVVVIILLRRSRRKARVTKPPGNPYDVFISYRRANSPDARSICAGLERYNLRVFLDVVDLGPGHFGEHLLQCIAKTPNYVVILSPNSLDRCSDEHDWLRQEIAQAIKTKRNIIPILMPGFSFPEQHMLPDDIRGLRLNQSVSYSHEFFDAMIEKVKRYVQYSA
jgi:hypothetical protein